jgi:ribonuclease P protein component
VKRAGRRLRTEHLEVRATDSLLSHVRVAVIVGKQGHTIVERNRLRRRLRELVRLKLIPRINGMDIVVRALSSGYEATFGQLTGEIDRVAADLSGQLRAS